MICFFLYEKGLIQRFLTIISVLYWGVLEFLFTFAAVTISLNQYRMKTRPYLFFLLLSLAAPVAQAQSSVQEEKDYVSRTEVLNTFHTPRLLQQKNLNPEALRALKFLYAYMPWPDVADYPLDYHVAQVEYALKARTEMKWGKSVPDREWYHFVLPVRVNNEHLDDFRTTCYEELKQRVQGLSMEQAVLEVNHWCHEHVTYQPSDSRTSSPLASMRTATGRCGEESTLLVAALRTVGIPARQVYTPRWAHTDDNHAWVEAYVHGRWHFLGACEPEPVLDLGWFNQPASRGMLMHTKVFGRYTGPEDVISANNCYTEINVTDNYARTARTTVCVVNGQGQPVSHARVDFKIYNYGELYTVQATHADGQGRASILTGLGDMVVWASDGTHYGWAQITGGKTEQVQVRLNRRAGERYTEELTLVPPKGENNLPEVTSQAAAANVRRLAQEDSIRTAYVRTFAGEEQTRQCAARTGLDYERVRRQTLRSCGNWQTLFALLQEFPEEATLEVLENLTDKDLRDFDREVLKGHLLCILPAKKAERQGGLTAGQLDFRNRYVHAPRIANENLSNWRNYFVSQLPKRLRQTIGQNPQRFAEWIQQNVEEYSAGNPMGYTLSPEKTYEGRRGHWRNQGLLFVAACRSMGVPARIDEVTGKVQYLLPAGLQQTPCEADAEWKTVNFSPQQSEVLSAQGEQKQVALDYSPRRYMENPAYYYHFTLSRLADGMPHLQNYAEGDNWKNRFESGVKVDAGDYLLTSGTRMADGTVLVRLQAFPVQGTGVQHEPLVMREDRQGVQVIGQFNAENRYEDPQSQCIRSILSTTGRGYYVTGLIRANHEPTNHILHDLEKMRSSLEAWGRPILLLFPNRDEYERFMQNRSEFTNLPSTLSFGIDSEGSVQADLFGHGLTDSRELPLIVIADTFNRVVFLSQGYTIGLGERIHTTVGKIE